MTLDPRRASRVTATALCLMLGAAAAPAVLAADPPAAAKKKEKAAPAKKSERPARNAKKVPPKPVEPPPPPEADAAQLEAAGMVYYGVYDCEFKQSVEINESPKFKGYVDVRHLKSNWVMKPVLSSTRAIRLEDVRGETLMVQIASKSMLLNVKTGTRIVDECVSPKQRELIEAARVKAAEATQAEKAGSATPASSAADGTSSAAPSVAVPTPVAPGASAAR